MSDLNPYTTSISHPFMASYANEGADVENLPVSKRWKRRFHNIKSAGGIAHAGLGSSGLNVLGFFFGPIYYLVKGMWRKAISLFCAVLVLDIAVSIALLFVGITPEIHRAINLVFSLGVSAVFALRANIDYYKAKVLNDKSWW